MMPQDVSQAAGSKSVDGPDRGSASAVMAALQADSEEVSVGYVPREPLFPGGPFPDDSPLRTSADTRRTVDAAVAAAADAAARGPELPIADARTLSDTNGTATTQDANGGGMRLRGFRRMQSVDLDLDDDDEYSAGQVPGYDAAGEVQEEEEGDVGAGTGAGGVMRFAEMVQRETGGFAGRLAAAGVLRAVLVVALRQTAGWDGDAVSEILALECGMMGVVAAVVSGAMVVRSGDAVTRIRGARLLAVAKAVCTTVFVLGLVYAISTATSSASVQHGDRGGNDWGASVPSSLLTALPWLLVLTRQRAAWTPLRMLGTTLLLGGTVIDVVLVYREAGATGTRCVSALVLASLACTGVYFTGYNMGRTGLEPAVSAFWSSLFLSAAGILLGLLTGGVPSLGVISLVRAVGGGTLLVLYDILLTDGIQGSSLPVAVSLL